MSELTFTSASDLASMIRGKKVSPVEVAEAYLQRIEDQNPRLNAFVHVAPERVLREAHKAEDAVHRVDALGPLHGVPLSIKSSIDVAGYRCEAGTKLRAGYVAARDAVLVGRLGAPAAGRRRRLRRGCRLAESAAMVAGRFGSQHISAGFAG